MDECGIYGVLFAEETLTGNVDSGTNIQGSLDANGILVGEVGFPKCFAPEVYSGEYDVIPKAHVMQTLGTNEKYMEDDVRVHEIPYYETSNQSGGITCYIANEL